MFRFLWRYLDEKKSPIIHEFTRIMFGMNAAPFEMQHVVRHATEKHQAEYPLVVEKVLESTYMDDTMDATETEENAIYLSWVEYKLRREPRRLMSKITSYHQQRHLE